MRIGFQDSSTTKHSDFNQAVDHDQQRHSIFTRVNAVYALRLSSRRTVHLLERPIRFYWAAEHSGASGQARKQSRRAPNLCLRRSVSVPQFERCHSPSPTQQPKPTNIPPSHTVHLAHTPHTSSQNSCARPPLPQSWLLPNGVRHMSRPCRIRPRCAVTDGCCATFSDEWLTISPPEDEESEESSAPNSPPTVAITRRGKFDDEEEDSDVCQPTMPLALALSAPAARANNGADFVI
jgi:hypothetical protein